MTTDSTPSPALFFETINSYQKSAAVKAALDLDLFTAVGTTATTAAELAARVKASDRGVRILCDYLVILGFLTKTGDCYALTPSSALFLSKSSPAYAGGAADFCSASSIKEAFDDLAAAVRKGGSAHSEMGTLSPDHPVWIQFARGLGPIMTPAAQALADIVPIETPHGAKILDIAASHCVFGIAFARKYPSLSLVALDWAPVLEVSRANAAAAGLSARFSTIEGSAFDVDLGTGYAAILIPNFLHHFDPPTCTAFLTKVHAALAPGGRVAIVEFVPNEDRVSPPESAGFSLVMLATTPSGDAYTFSEYGEMLDAVGFRGVERHPLEPSVETAILAIK